MADDSTALAGHWQIVSAELAGEKMPDLVAHKIEVELAHGTYTVRFGGEIADQGTFTLGSHATAKAITLTGVAGTNAGRTIPAIYRFDAAGLIHNEGNHDRRGGFSGDGCHQRRHRLHHGLESGRFFRMLLVVEPSDDRGIVRPKLVDFLFLVLSGERRACSLLGGFYICGAVGGCDGNIRRRRRGRISGGVRKQGSERQCNDRDEARALGPATKRTGQFHCLHNGLNPGLLVFHERAN